MDVASEERKLNKNIETISNRKLGIKLHWVLDQLSKVTTVPAVIRMFVGSASTYKYDFNAFINRYIFPGNHCMMSIHDFLAEVQKSDMELLTVHSDRHSYYLTCKAWAENLAKNRDYILERWGRELYAKFNLYLWGVAHNLRNNQIQAYRVVLTHNPPRS